MRSGVVRTAAFLAAACGSKDRPALDRPADSSVSAPSSSTDSLALRLSGAEIWFTDTRPASDSLGHSCHERVLEIRRAGDRIPVPLLYTGEAPVEINDSTIQARLWQQCRPAARYNVDLRTGRPTRAR